MRFPGIGRKDRQDAHGETAPVLGHGKPKRRGIVGTVQILAVAGVIVLAFLLTRAPSGEAVPAGPPGGFAAATAPTPLVAVVTPASGETTLSVTVTGSIAVRNRIALTPQITGRVASVSNVLRPGGAFAAGEQLLVIEPRDFELALRQARADIANALSTLRLRRAEGDAARQNYAILNPGQAVPPLVAKEPQIEQAQAQLAAARARADIARLDLSRTRFTLPFAGRVIETTAEVGQVLTRGQPFGQAFALDAVEVVAPIAPDDLARISPAIGRAAEVRIDPASMPAATAGNTVLPARVERVSAELDERTRFARVYLTFDSATDLPPGTFVDIHIDGPTLVGTYRLPEAANQLNGQVWIVADGKLARREPTIRGRVDGGFVVDAFDYEAGVVLGAVPAARDGLVVEVAGSGT